MLSLRPVVSHRSPVRSARAEPAARGQQGAVVIYVALFALVLVGFLGIGLDAAQIYLAGHELQNVADGCALAAARLVVWESDGDPDNPFEATRDAARYVAALNTVANTPLQLDPMTDVAIGRWDPATGTFSSSLPDDLAEPNAVRITTRRTITMNFASMTGFGVGSGGMATSEVEAVATATTAATESPLLLVRDGSASGALTLSDGATLDAGGGQVRVNSAADCALQLSGGAFLNSQETKAKGGACTSGGAAIAPGVHEAQPLADPLAGLLPDNGSWQALKASMPQPELPDDVGQVMGEDLPPGHYPAGLMLTAGQHVTLAYGEQYVIGGAGLHLAAGAMLEGQGVTLFMDEGARIRIDGPSSLLISAPQDGPFADIAIFHHRGNGLSGAGAPEFALSGSGVYVDVHGTTYLPGGRFSSSATGHLEFGEMIVRTISMSGSGELEIAGDGLPTFGTPFLVE
jgi:hypothetical protein